MKYLIVLIFLIAYQPIFAQSKTEHEVLQLSKEIFRLEVVNQIDSLSNYLHEKLIVVNSKGEVQNKGQYISTFKSGNFIHNSIEIEEDIVRVEKNTATIAGKGKFNITAAGNNVIRHLSYIETFVETKAGWKLFALKASILPN